MVNFGPVIPIYALDWDQTLADTFTPSPNGRGVIEGYRHGLKELFGDPDLLEEIGGLQNRAPGQIVRAVLEKHPELRERAHEYYQRRERELRGFVPRGKGIRNAKPGSDELLHEALVRVRLEYLLPEITPEWPKMYPGAADALSYLREAGRKIAITSSGHHAFIEKTCRVWGIAPPSIIVTDDDLRALGLPPEESCKPHPIVTRTVLTRAALETAMCTAPVAYEIEAVIGDCVKKDRMLAKNAGARFGWFNPKREEPPEDFKTPEFQFHSWDEIPQVLN